MYPNVKLTCSIPKMKKRVIFETTINTWHEPKMVWFFLVKKYWGAQTKRLQTSFYNMHLL